MKLLNLACGATRPGEPWTNLDNLFDVLEIGTPERDNLNKEVNYVEHDILDPLPFSGSEFDGVLCSHALEHFDCHWGLKIMRGCHRILKPGGILMVSVPDASYFRLMHSADTAENAVELFGEPIYAPDGEATFFGYALWNRFHHAILTEDALWAYFRRAGFNGIDRIGSVSYEGDEVTTEMHKILNRRLFSLVMVGYKL